jgi:hypothetical protein
MKIELSKQDQDNVCNNSFTIKIIKETDGTNLFCDKYYVCHLPGSDLIADRILVFKLLIDLKEFIINSILCGFISIEDYKNMIVSDPGGTNFYKMKLNIQFEKMK